MFAALQPRETDSNSEWIEAPLNISHLRQLLQDCDSMHDGPCRIQMLVPPQQLILINVSEKCLERRDPESFPQGVRYLALSYNWGKVDQLLATTENLDLLSSPNALERPEFHTKIPQVIQDAMRSVEGLGESYLWVDALCIVQDDIEEKQKQIAQMGSIYSNALCTIIALAGLDANTRLAGISPRRVHVDDLKEPVDHGHLLISLLGSRYMERAWTFQERILSRRCLYFTAYGVWFQCKRHVVRERFSIPNQNPPVLLPASPSAIQCRVSTLSTPYTIPESLSRRMQAYRELLTKPRAMRYGLASLWMPSWVQ
jgi:hypothetical protein